MIGSCALSNNRLAKIFSALGRVSGALEQRHAIPEVEKAGPRASSRRKEKREKRRKEEEKEEKKRRRSVIFGFDEM